MWRIQFLLVDVRKCPCFLPRTGLGLSPAKVIMNGGTAPLLLSHQRWCCLSEFCRCVPHDQLSCGVSDSWGVIQPLDFMWEHYYWQENNSHHIAASCLSASGARCGFQVSRIEPLCSPACRKRRLIEGSRIACWGYTISGESLRPNKHLGQYVRWPGPAGTLKDHHYHHQLCLINYFQKITCFIYRLRRYTATCADVP